MKLLILNLFAVTLMFSSLVKADDYYNETHDEQGRVRSQYAEIYARWDQMTEAEKRQFLKDSRQAFRGDNALYSLPKVLTKDEAETLRKGTAQRGKAIVAFLKDYYSGTNGFQSFLPMDVVQTIVQRNFESAYLGQLDPEKIGFFYGPDIIRDAQGQWRVIEDNPGFIGGLGDLRLANELMRDLYPDDIDEYENPNSFYKRIAKYFKKQSELYDGQEVVLYSMPPYADNEDPRLQRILKEYGIISVTPNSKYRIKVTDKGVFVYNREKGDKAKLKKVGYVVLNGEHAWMDLSDRDNLEKNIVGYVEEFIKQNHVGEKRAKRLRNYVQAYKASPDSWAVEAIRAELEHTDFAEHIHWEQVDTRMAKGLTGAFLKGQVGMNYSPGVDFIGDKQFYLYIEDMIRFYLHEEPILKNIETQSFADKDKTFRADLFQHATENQMQYVIKRVDGRGGDAVWVGSKIEKNAFVNLQEAIAREPGAFILQKYTALSQILDHIGDVRQISYISSDKAIVSKVAWARGLPKDGNGKVNLSDQGKEFTVLAKKAYSCERVFLH